MSTEMVVPTRDIGRMAAEPPISDFQLEAVFALDEPHKK
jgi:hypothetical protein